LKKLGHATDSSYSNQILKVTPDAYLSLLDDYIENEVKEKIVNELIKRGLIQDKTFKGLVKLILKALANKTLNIASDSFSDSFIEEYISPIIIEPLKHINTIITLLQ